MLRFAILKPSESTCRSRSPGALPKPGEPMNLDIPCVPRLVPRVIPNPVKTAFHFWACTVLAASLSSAAEVVATSKEGHEAVNLSLHPTQAGEARALTPGNGFEEQMNGVFRWSKVPAGPYQIVIDPDEEDWSAHWIGIRAIDVKDDKLEIDLAIPRGHAEVAVTFDGIEPPVQHGVETGRVFRVERLLANGQPDPFYRMWLWGREKDDHWTGELSYLTPGDYRLVAFEVTEAFDSKDVATGKLTLTATDLEKHAAKVVIRTPVKSSD